MPTTSASPSGSSAPTAVLPCKRWPTSPASPRATSGDIEKGRKNPTTDVIEAIAEALGVPARELLYHAALDEEDPFLLPEQLTLEDTAEEDAETRELNQLARRMRPTDRRFVLDLARRLSR